jgi:hypothetical protein
MDISVWITGKGEDFELDRRRASEVVATVNKVYAQAERRVTNAV